MPVSFSTLLPNRIRRDEARVRRQGTGRVTTKRTFSLNVFKGSQLGQFGRKTGLPLKQGVKRDAYGLDDVDNFWRDSLEGAPSDQQAEGAGEPPAPISHEAPAPVAEPVAEENPFLRANKLMRTPGPGVPRPPMVRASPRAPPPSSPLRTRGHGPPPTRCPPAPLLANAGDRGGAGRGGQSARSDAAGAGCRGGAGICARGGGGGCRGSADQPVQAARRGDAHAQAAC